MFQGNSLPSFCSLILLMNSTTLRRIGTPFFLAFAKKPKRWTRESFHGQFLSTANPRRRKSFRRCCNMPDPFLHERSDFKALVATVADTEKINDPALVEKDYWIMHAVFGLKQLGLTFELKGGTSLSKGFGIIQRFSEDIDIRIEPLDGLQVDTNPNHGKPQHIDSRRQFYEKLRDKIKISGITAVERDTTYDDETLRNAGLRLSYETHFGSIAGLKDGILLEVGFDQTTPNRFVTDFVLDRPVRGGQESSIHGQPSPRHPLL